MLGVQSSFFSPIKYSILPQHLEKRELIIGNGWISSGTYLAILAGTIVGAALGLMENGKVYTAVILMIAALAGYIASRFVPAATPPEPGLAISYYIFKKILWQW